MISTKEVYKMPCPTVWLLYEGFLEESNRIRALGIEDPKDVEERYFDEEWQRETAPPAWWVAQQKQKNRQ